MVDRQLDKVRPITWPGQRWTASPPTLALDKDEARSLLAAARLAGPRDHALIALLVFNGLRTISEALGATVGDLTVGDLAYERGHRDTDDHP